MENLLFINANPREIDKSYTGQMSYYFLDAYKKAHPENKVKILNLYDLSPPFMSDGMLKAIKNNEPASKKWAEEFKSFDKYLVASPYWSISIPSILKAYIDLIAIPGETFEYNDDFYPQGLLKDKKMVIITSSAAICTNDGKCTDMNFPYLKNIFNLLGIENIQHFGMDGILSKKEILETHMGIIKKQLEQFASTF